MKSNGNIKKKDKFNDYSFYFLMGAIVFGAVYMIFYFIYMTFS